MRYGLYVAFAAGTLMLAPTIGAEPAAAAIYHPWCNSSAGSNPGTCGFDTAAQCWASVQGGTGGCTMNPFYQDQPPARLRGRQR